ncbi:alpha/beta hydrolase [Nocardioides nanhaiensis]|uniref:Alpha/beta hydrolase n=1 Tax=Nocardioides nanhaiensis TaxID=1476871 RepID=A0ABP8WJG1_9ACTN
MRARLIDVATPRDPAGIVVVLHGGGSRRGSPAVSPTQLSVLRMLPVARTIARAGRRRLAVSRLLNSHRGWDASHTPVDDASWAVRQLRERHPGVPVALVGHSLGGRAALLAGSLPPVTTVVALNPWLQATDDVDLTGRHVLVVHGTEDRIASPQRSRTLADRLARRPGVELTWHEVAGGKHAMLSHRGEFERTAARFVVEHLLADHDPARE